MVVPQAINPYRAAAHNWPHIFNIRFILLLGRIKPPYKILSKSFEKQKSYGVIFSAQFVRRRFVRKWKCLKFVIFEDPSIKSLYTRQDNAIGYFLVNQIHVHDIFFSKPKDSLFYTFPVC